MHVSTDPTTDEHTIISQDEEVQMEVITVDANNVQVGISKAVTHIR